MIKRLIEGSGCAKQLEDERGAALVELALCMSVLLLLVFAVIDFSNMIYDNQVMSGMSRQGSNLASRGGASLAETVSSLVTQGAALNIGTQGRIIVTAVKYDSSNKAQIEQEESATGIAATSLINSWVTNSNNIPENAKTVLSNGRTLYVTEVFYSYRPITPLPGFLKHSVSSAMYEAAYF